MLAFPDSKTAVKWALECQELLIQADWPEELFQNDDSAIAYDSKKRLIYRGFRVRMVRFPFSARHTVFLRNHLGCSYR